MGVEIRSLTAADIPVADAILSAAFKRDVSFAPELARYLRLQTDGWLLATFDGREAGTVGAYEYGRFAWLGLMAVAPELQGRGVAKALIAALLSWLDAHGCPLVLLDASAEGAPLYPGFGFVDRDEVVVYGRTATAARPPHRPASIAVPRPDDLPEVAAFDQPEFGADRREVLGSYLADYPDRVLISRDEHHRIDGYLVAQPRRLGPWVAASSAAAEALLAAALTLSFAGPPAMLVPGANAAAAALLPRYGFTPVDRLRHMGRGSGSHGAQRAHIYGQASFTLG